MAIKLIKASKDTTIFSESLFANAGQSEILALGIRRRYEDIKNVSDTGSINRCLIKFGETAQSTSLSEITDLITNEYISSSNAVTASLKMFHAYSDDYASTYNIEINPISRQWDEGDGFSLEQNDSGSCTWTQSDDNTYWTCSGADTHSGYLTQITQSHGDDDINTDVSTIVEAWILGTIDNYGLLLNVNNELFDTGSRVKYLYSRHTNTPFHPSLEISWDDRIRDDRNSLLNNSSDNKLYLYNKRRGQYQNLNGIGNANDVLYVNLTDVPHPDSSSVASVSASWIRKGIYQSDAINLGINVTCSVYDHWYSGSTLLTSGTCSVVTSSFDDYLESSYDYYVLTLPNLNAEYQENDEAELEVFAMEKYPHYEYTTSSINQLHTETLFNASYSLYDYQTNEKLIDYSKFTALSYNKDLNWFRFYFSGLPVNRSMYFEIKYDRDGTVRYEKIMSKPFILRQKD